MNLKKSRDEMRENFNRGHIPDLVVKYRIERDKEDWRSSRAVEELLEYILFIIEKQDIN